MNDDDDESSRIIWPRVCVQLLTCKERSSELQQVAMSTEVVWQWRRSQQRDNQRQRSSTAARSARLFVATATAVSSNKPSLTQTFISQLSHVVVAAVFFNRKDICYSTYPNNNQSQCGDSPQAQTLCTVVSTPKILYSSEELSCQVW